MKPLCIDLFCGLGGWAEGFLAEGYDVIGFDIERHDYGTGGYSGQLVLQDVLTLDGAQFRRAACIVASPPCQKYSYMAMPWKRAKAMAAWYREAPARIADLNALFDACFRIQREACGIPMVVENVKGAQPWVGEAKCNFGSYYLWGSIDSVNGMIHAGRIEFGNVLRSPARCLKQSGRNFHFLENFGIPSPSFHGKADEPSVAAAMAIKTVGHANKRDGHTHTRHLTNQRESDAIKQPGLSGEAWFNDGASRFSSGSTSRKAASAQIAKIPFPLANHIARVFKPDVSRVGSSGNADHDTCSFKS